MREEPCRRTLRVRTTDSANPSITFEFRHRQAFTFARFLPLIFFFVGSPCAQRRRRIVHVNRSFDCTISTFLPRKLFFHIGLASSLFFIVFFRFSLPNLA